MVREGPTTGISLTQGPELFGTSEKEKLVIKF